MPNFRQPSFAGGELDPKLWGRSDLAKHAVGLRKARNFFVTREGAAMSRPGSSYVQACRSTTGAPRLISFTYGLSSFILELGVFSGAGYCRAIPVVGGPFLVQYDVATPYTQAELADVRYVQVGAVVTLVHPNHPPAELKWSGGSTWTYSVISYVHPDPVTSTIFNAYGKETLPTADATHPSREWRYQVTALVVNTSGQTVETKPYTVSGSTPDGGTTVNSMPTSLPVYPDKPVTIQVVSNVYFGTIYGFRIYRGIGSVMGYVGFLDSFGTFTDAGAVPDYTQAPPKSTNPWVLGSGTVAFGAHRIPTTTTDYPAAVTMFEDRRVFGGTSSRPGGVFCSTSGDYYNHDSQVVPTEASAIDFDLASQRYEQILHLLTGPKMLAFTGTGAWAIGGAAGAPLAFDSIDAKRHLDMGSYSTAPLEVEGNFLFVRSKGVGVRALAFDFARQQFSAADLSAMAPHLFQGFSIADWAYAEDPYGLVLAVRGDGTMLCLTYAPQHDVWAWTHWDADNASYKAVCTVPGANKEDIIYTVVQRTVSGTVTYSISKFESRVVTDATVGSTVCVDAAVRYTGTATSSITGLTHIAGKSVMVVSDGNVSGPYTVTSGGAVTLPEAVTNYIVGIPFVPELETLDLATPTAELKGKTQNVRKVGLELDETRGVSVGQDFDHLTEWQQRQVSDSYGSIAAATGFQLINVNGAWRQGGGRVALRQTWPLPVTVLSVVRYVEFGDD